MRNIILFSALALLVSGCALPTRQPVTGLLYSDTKATENVTDNTAAPKTGMACMSSIIGIATGDASMEAAKKAGGITQVAYVDNTSEGILGLWAKYCLVVHGK